MQRIEGKEDSAFEYLSLQTGKKVCCSNGHSFEIRLAQDRNIQLADCKDLPPVCNEVCDGRRFRRLRRRLRRRQRHKG